MKDLGLGGKNEKMKKSRSKKIQVQSVQKRKSENIKFKKNRKKKMRYIMTKEKTICREEEKLLIKKRRGERGMRERRYIKWRRRRQRER